MVDAVLFYEQPKTIREFTMARAICDPRDHFDEEFGIDLAIKRLEDGEVIGTQTSFDVTMLNDDQCEALVDVEVRHICNKIDTYINKGIEQRATLMG